MEILRSYPELAEWASQHGNAMAATIGFFDGLHRGHQYLLSELYHLTMVQGLKSLIVTFRNAPRGFHQPEHDWLHITTTEEKLYLLAQTSIDATLVLEYTEDIANLSAAVFLQGLNQYCPLSALCVGYDSRLGRDQIAGREEYEILCRRLGLHLRFVEALSKDNLPLKSRLARDLISNGRMQEAQQVLGRPYFVMQEIVHGKGLGGTRMGIPTANMLLPLEKLTPPTGVYACLAEVDGMMYPAATCVMSSEQAHRTVLEREQRAAELPTELNRVVMESHLLDYHGDLYGQRVILNFIKHIRGWVDFESVEQLKQQLDTDFAAVRSALDR
jgi:riboflavin kinase / FMN adenylyltransferase